MLRAEPETLFSFGKSLQQMGKGGPAAEMSGEPNAIGIRRVFAANFHVYGVRKSLPGQEPTPDLIRGSGSNSAGTRS